MVCRAESYAGEVGSERVSMIVWQAVARLRRSRLFVSLAPMCDPRHVDGFGRVVNLADNAVVTHTNAPFVSPPLSFLHP